MILVVFMISWQSDNYKSNLLVLKDPDGRFRKISSQNDWNKRREQILDSIELVMGKLPCISGKVPADIKVIEEKPLME
ncbi:MAG: hypothetical protein IPJ37_14835 [Bacteroidales bacterium]|nr:hypothetical protein [Bacteroidales bacterium]